jgi:hypothetical protein
VSTVAWWRKDRGLYVQVRCICKFLLQCLFTGMSARKRPRETHKIHDFIVSPDPFVVSIKLKPVRDSDDDTLSFI